MRGRLFLVLISFSLLGVLVVALFLVRLLPKSAFEPQKLETVPKTLDAPPITFLDPSRGDMNAKYTLVEYGDYSCVLCRQIEPDIQAWVTEAPNNRRTVWKDAPDAITHPESIAAAMAARCAQDQGKFWEYHDRLMSGGTALTADNLKSLAESLNLNMESFDKCVSSEVTRPIIEHGLEEAVALKISGTPTLYLNGALYTGPLSLEAFRKSTK